MATVPTMRTWTDTEVVDASMMNSNIRDALNFLLSRPKFQGRQTVAQSIPNTGFTSITFDVEDVDTDGGHSTVTNTSRYTAQTAGYYLCSGHATFVNTSAGGDRRAILALNGTAVNGSNGNNTSDASVPYSVPVNTMYIYLNIGDYIELQVSQSSTGALNTNVSGSYQSMLSVLWIST